MSYIAILARIYEHLSDMQYIYIHTMFGMTKGNVLLLTTQQPTWVLDGLRPGACLLALVHPCCSSHAWHARGGCRHC